MFDVKSIRKKILNDGYYHLKNIFDENEINVLRKEIEKSIDVSPEYSTRINSDNIEDYHQYRSHDNIKRTLRYYMFFHNQDKWNETVKKILLKSLNLRNNIEEEWIDNFEYNDIKKKLQDYIIVTKYCIDSGLLKYHRDFPKKTEYPLLQFNILISQPNIDYSEGDFIFIDYHGKEIAIQKDLNASMGDAIIFDKHLLHKVENTLKGNTDIGRWSVLVGTRAEYTSKIRLFVYKSSLFKFYKKLSILNK